MDAELQFVINGLTINMVKTFKFPGVLKFWFLVPLASKAARNDLKLVQQLRDYTDRDTRAETLSEIAGHLRLVSGDSIIFSLFDPEVDSISKSSKGYRTESGNFQNAKNPSY